MRGYQCAFWTSEKWAANNPILAKGELAYDETAKGFKVGDGKKHWLTLPFILGSGEVVTPFEMVSQVNNLRIEINNTINLLPAQNLHPIATSGNYADLINKPAIPVLPALAAVATSGNYADLNGKPTIPVLPALAAVATSGNYDDLTNKPTNTNNGGGAVVVGDTQLITLTIEGGGA